MKKRYTPETGIVQINVKIPRDAKAILDQFATGPKAHGQLLARLLFEHAVRQKVEGVMKGKVQTIEVM